MGFTIAHDNPNILVYDLNSPAGESIRNSYALYTLDDIFRNRFIKTYTVDNKLLYNNININYNKYVFQISSFKDVKTVWNGRCNVTVSETIKLDPVQFDRKPFSDERELWEYIRIRQKEEGDNFSSQKLENIFKKSKYFLKKVDKTSALGYIDNMFRDQVWNKDYGFHDAIVKLDGQTQTEAQRQQTRGGPSRGGSSY